MVHNHQTTLRKHGYDVKVGDKYQLGLKFLEVSGHIWKFYKNMNYVIRKNDFDALGSLPTTHRRLPKRRVDGATASVACFKNRTISMNNKTNDAFLKEIRDSGRLSVGTVASLLL
ncbi:hypothetical protein HAL_23880 [Haladaptatus sp. T7]|nr:hypothetical protein HAL_23880 [Haladaptatus sp. T7]